MKLKISLEKQRHTSFLNKLHMLIGINSERLFFSVFVLSYILFKIKNESRKSTNIFSKRMRDTRKFSKRLDSNEEPCSIKPSFFGHIFDLRAGFSFMEGGLDSIIAFFRKFSINLWKKEDNLHSNSIHPFKIRPGFIFVPLRLFTWIHLKNSCQYKVVVWKRKPNNEFKIVLRNKLNTYPNNNQKCN